MAKAGRKNTPNDLQARIQAEEFWRSRARWLMGTVRNERGAGRHRIFTGAQEIRSELKEWLPSDPQRLLQTTKQIRHDAIKYVREITGLTKEDVSDETINKQIVRPVLAKLKKQKRPKTFGGN